jgi:hypothetical protein
VKRALIALVLAMLALTPFLAAEPHALDLQLGNFRPPYYYPIMDLGYRSPGLFAPLGLRLEMRMRSFGTFYLFNPASYDLGFMVTCDVLKNGPSAFLLGAGLDWRLRFTRYLPPGGIEPLIAVGARFELDRLELRPMLLSRLYADGLSLTLQPEALWNLGPLSLSLRSELAFLYNYATTQNAWTWTNLAGIRLNIP